MREKIHGGIRGRKHVDHGCFKMPPKASRCKEENHDVFGFLRHSSKNECLLCSSAEFLGRKFDLRWKMKLGLFKWCPQVNDYLKSWWLGAFRCFFCKANLPKIAWTNTQKWPYFCRSENSSGLQRCLVPFWWCHLDCLWWWSDPCVPSEGPGLGSRVESCRGHSCHSCWMVWREIQLKKSWDDLGCIKSL